MAPVGLLAATLALGGCSGITSALGYDRTVPDEFAVVARAPLTLPPTTALNPPTPGAPRPQEGTATDRAESVVFGTGSQGILLTGAVTVAGSASRGEVTLLDRAGAGAVQPNIRLVVERETDQAIRDSEGLIDSLLFWQTKDPAGVVVDAAAESRRLANNAALGVPLNEGDVPVIEPREKAPLEGLFDF